MKHPRLRAMTARVRRLDVSFTTFSVTPCGSVCPDCDAPLLLVQYGLSSRDTIIGYGALESCTADDCGFARVPS